ncbi:MULTISPECIES: sensor histidine kinase KdpD [Halobacterium]|uniref:sensor histidine kinase n=1 Tax=Halobacterium TaxID=2239 RepID=UPI00073E8EE8|nr:MULTISPECIES: HAMP domain-containing sensor histidine kinase [Halobacterium]MCG1004085.1 HAMP domain-containing histidine kinase [Halobacterium noricense]
MTVDTRRAAASATISLTGLVVVAVMVRHVLTSTPPTSGWLLAGFGGLVGAALVAAGFLVYRAEFTAGQTLRIAGWNALGIVVIGAALGLLYAYQSAVSALPAAPVFSGSVVVAVSAVAHVLIGVNDARRIRTRELAREREKLDVLSRLVRHNLRTEAQRLYSYATRVRVVDDEADREEVGDEVHGSGERLAELHEHITTIRNLVDSPPKPHPYDVNDAVADIAADLRADYPDATIEVTGGDATAAAGDYLADAIRELVENALQHNDRDEPWVGIEVVRTDGRVEVIVRDDGPEIPDVERETVTGKRELTQLSHGSGVGLWLVRWIADAYDGRLFFGEYDDGNEVVVSIPAA